MLLALSGDAETTDGLGASLVQRPGSARARAALTASA